MAVKLNYPIRCYGVINRDKSELMASSSGGAFSIFARAIIEHGGVVYGHAFCGKNVVRCIRVDSLEELSRLRGSKYVQSDMGEAMSLVLSDLREGRVVLFSGTPCQVAGLTSLVTLSKVDRKNLYLVDILCHGVPSPKFFLDCIDYEHRRSTETTIQFRDKRCGWSCAGSVRIKPALMPRMIKPFDSLTSFYYSAFHKGESLRESCYRCPYAGALRPGDITLGDYWGIDHVSAQLNPKDGISLVLVNSEKGLRLTRMMLQEGKCVERPVEEAIRGNEQLRHPVVRPEKRDLILNEWSEGGLEKLERRFRSENRLRRIAWRLKWALKRMLSR